MLILHLALHGRLIDPSTTVAVVPATDAGVPVEQEHQYEGGDDQDATEDAEQRDIIPHDGRDAIGLQDGLLRRAVIGCAPHEAERNEVDDEQDEEVEGLLHDLPFQGMRGAGLPRHLLSGV